MRRRVAKKPEEKPPQKKPKRGDNHVIPRDSNTGRAKDGKLRKGKHPVRAASFAERDAEIFRAVLRFTPVRQLAKQYNIDERTVTRIYRRMLQENGIRHQEDIDIEVAQAYARYEQAQRVAYIRAHGGILEETNANGETVRTKYEPDIEWMRVWTKLQRDRTLMTTARQTIRVEHTGKVDSNVTADISISDEARAAAAFRQAFGNAVAKPVNGAPPDGSGGIPN